LTACGARRPPLPEDVEGEDPSKKAERGGVEGSEAVGTVIRRTGVELAFAATLVGEVFFRREELEVEFEAVLEFMSGLFSSKTSFLMTG